MACSSLGFIGMVLAHPQRPAAYSALRLLVHIIGSFPIFVAGPFWLTDHFFSYSVI